MPETTKLIAALVAVQSELTNAPLDGVNPHFKSRYTTLSALLNHLRPVLAKHGLAVSQSITIADKIMTVRTAIMHSSGEAMEETLDLYTDRQSPQGAGSAITYGRRYALAAIFGIAGEEDDDANTAEEGAKEAQAERRNESYMDRVDKAVKAFAGVWGCAAEEAELRLLKKADLRSWLDADDFAQTVEWLRHEYNDAKKEAANGDGD